MKADVDDRLIQNFMDIIILRLVKENQCTSGYDIIRYFHHKFHKLVSSGTVYSRLYSLERQGLIEGKFDGRRRVYKVTDDGVEFFREICMTGQRNQAVFMSIFSTF
jgi:DNA-binding PadR family transcriptional regulator